MAQQQNLLTDEQQNSIVEYKLIYLSLLSNIHMPDLHIYIFSGGTPENDADYHTNLYSYHLCRRFSSKSVPRTHVFMPSEHNNAP